MKTGHPENRPAEPTTSRRVGLHVELRCEARESRDRWGPEGFGGSSEVAWACETARTARRNETAGRCHPPQEKPPGGAG